jgi:hypothetical protein
LKKRQSPPGVNQKTFVYMAHADGENRDSNIKVFCFFSSEKKAFY